MNLNLGLSFVGALVSLKAFGRWVLNFDGTIYADLSQPKIFTGVGAITFEYKTSGGILQEFIDGYQITAADVFNTPVEVTDILVDDISVGLGASAPVDSQKHTVTFVVSSMTQKNIIGNDFQGIIYSAEFADSIIPSNSISWTLDSGIPDYDTSVYKVAMYDKNTYELKPQLWGVGAPTTMHSMPMYAEDHEGIYREFVANEPVWKGGRVVTNEILHSELFTFPGWAGVGGWSISNATKTITDPVGIANSAWEITLLGIGGGGFGQSIGGSWVESEGSGAVWLKMKTGSATVNYNLQGSIAAVDSAITITDTWHKFTVTAQDIKDRLKYPIILNAGFPDNAVVHIWHPHTEVVDGRTNTLPSEYIKTEATPVTKVFANENSTILQPTGLVLTMRTTSADEQITMPLNGTNDCTIDWGDGQIEYINTINPTHIYTSAGDHEIEVWGSTSSIAFSQDFTNADKLVRVSSLGINNWLLFNGGFKTSNSGILEEFVVDFTNTSSVTDMSYMMGYWSNMVITPDLSSINTSNVTDMSYMMREWYSMTIPPDLSNFDTTKVDNMAYMMKDWVNMITPPDLSSLNTANVINMSNMMDNWSSMTTPPELSYFDTIKVDNMAYMMNDWSSMTIPPDLSNFNTTNVSYMWYMMKDWLNMTTPPNLSNFNTTNVITMFAMMDNWSSMTTPPDLSSFDTSKVTNMSYMMRNWSSMGAIDLPIYTWNIGLVTTMDLMLSGTQLTTACYDRTLIAWAAQTVQPNVPAHFGATTTYTLGGAAEAARDILLAAGWTITDGGGI